MSKFYELKKEAEIAIEQKWFNRLREEDAIAILELLAIQAQLVAVLKYSKRFLKKEDADIDFIDAALVAAGAQP